MNNDELRTEQKMEEWIKEFIKEIDMIDKFFVDKQKEFLSKFKEMRSQYIDKINSNQKETSNKKKKHLKDKEIFEKLSLFKKRVMENNDLELRDENLSKEFEDSGNTKKMIGKNLKKVKDGFEYAINWERVFVDLYRHLEWLSSYAD